MRTKPPKAKITSMHKHLGINDRHMVIGTVEQIRDSEGIGWIEVRITPIRETPSEPLYGDDSSDKPRRELSAITSRGGAIESLTGGNTP